MTLPGLTWSQRHRKSVSWIFVTALLFLLLFSTHSWERNNPIDLFFEVAGLFLIVVCTFGRLWASVYACGYKDELVIESGPYSTVRNPLYLFSFIGVVGMGLVSENLLILLLASLFFLVYYRFVVRSEERYLLTKFGERYADYLRRVPRFIPRLRLLQEPDSYLVNVRVYRKSLLDATMFIWLYIVFHFIERLQQMGILPIFFRVP
ncbi:MAG: isoprenylcysteine carboxylmethyltransferase family protein [Syntrophaceae bacterium]|nr:isoprenylcysteine carboxylmethyltransferase family protein [Syntrophaceae bacterium]